ncbi:hypothetical protein F53441_4242 [Fusarium austroafricanum]|uniref:Xylanolytic transcriptional activator regulatory domain-containing protein n=1 Tax=Fusarium austroafricanum TaxID=2364996 RepID=A0A8H4KNB3_9HYPO|nr:hypothetical protein F53441_4242 [Fusarium austroafricanum]
MYQPPYLQSEPYQPYHQQQQQQPQSTYEYKPVTAQEVYPFETDAGQPEKRERERPDYRPIPLRWPFISALILVLLGLMGLIIYAVRTLDSSDTTAILENRSFRITNENLFYMKRQDTASEASQPEATAAEPGAGTEPGTEETQGSGPSPTGDPTDGGEGGTLTTALVESVFTTMVTKPGTLEVEKTTETITETGETTRTETITEAASTYTSLIPEESVPPESWEATTVIQPGQTKTSIIVEEQGAVRTTVRETTRTGPPVTYASVGTTTIYSVLTLDSNGKAVKPPVTRVRTSEVAATVKTIVDAPPPVTMVQTLADGQVITSVSTPIGTTRVTTVPPTRVVITDVSTPTGNTRIVVEATTHTLTESGYFIGKFLPPIVAVLLAMGIRALNQSAQQYQPFAALTRQGGALGREALLLSFDGWMSIYLPFKLLFNNQPLPFLTALALWASSIVAPLSSEAIGLKIYGRCRKGAIDGCALELGVSNKAAYALVGLLGAIAILLAFTLSVISRHWRTGVFANPWCAANTAALVARNPEIRSMGAKDWKDLKSAVTEKRFAMGWFRNQKGRDEYGVVVVGHIDRDIAAPYGNTPYVEGQAYRPQTRRRAPQTFMALSFWYRFTFLVFLICLLGFVSYYHFVDTFGHLPKNMRKLMESQDFGVRFVCSALGVIVVFCWEFLFTSVAVITPFRRMAEDPQVPTRSVLMTPATNPVSGFFAALRVRDPLLFFTAFTTLLAQFLPILLANVPYSLTQTSDAHEICSRLSIGILLIMVVAMLSSLLVKWPDLPVDPRSLAGALWYVADAPWVRGLEGVAAMSAKHRKDAVQGLGGKWTQCTYPPRAGSSTTEGSLSQDDSASATATQITVSPEVQSSNIASSPQSNILVSADESTPSLSDENVLSLVNQYFDRMSPLPSFCFLHQATVIQRCHDKTIDRALQLALYAITAVYFHKYPEERDSWADEGERLLLDRLDQPSIFKIQASLLLIRYRAAVGQFPRAFIMAGLAARWAAALRLNYEHSKLSPVAQEVRRRTFWSLTLLEDTFCVGLKEFELFDPDTIYLQLPCEDVDFHQERPTATGYLQPGKGLEPEVLGSRAAFVRLAFIRRNIMRLNRRISLKEVNLPELFSSMEKFQNDLLRLRTKLAPCDQYPSVYPQGVHLSPQYFIMHMSWHQCHCDLYRIFVAEYFPFTPHVTIEDVSPSERALMKDKCLSHAEEIVKVLSDMVQHKDDKEILEFDAAVCAYHSARLILFGAYTGKDNSGLPMQMAISKAQLCLDIIAKYFDFSEQLKAMRQELERFIQQHKTWLESSHNRPITTADPTSKPSSKLSKDAYIRQRLAIHSLLRQSDFVDDSRDAAPEAPPEPALSWTASTEDEQSTAEVHTDWSSRELQPASDNLMDPSLLFGLPFGGGLDMNAWYSMTETQDLSGFLTDFDEQNMY